MRSTRMQLLSVLISCLLIARSVAVITTEINSLKRFAVTCGSAILEGILRLTPEADAEFWHKCRFEDVPKECEASCGGVRLSKDAHRDRIRSCWLCHRWRIHYVGRESMWVWSPMLIAACEALGFGPTKDFVDLFSDDAYLYKLALASTLPLASDNGVRGGGGGGAGIEIWCGSERVVWMGGGGGGGRGNLSRGRGTGAGLQTSLGWSLGAGGGGGVKEKIFNNTADHNVRKKSISFGFEKDDLGSDVREGTPEDISSLREYLRRCYVDHNLSVVGGGGSDGTDGYSAAMRFTLTSCSDRSHSIF